jgi:hypothetical protein
MKGKPSEEEVADFFRDLQESADRDLFPKLKGSRFAMAIIEGGPDVKLCLEVGASLLLDKPLLLLVKRGSFLVPLKLRNIADAVVEFDSFSDVEARLEIQEAVRRILHPGGVQ